MVMPSNASGTAFGYLAGRYDGLLGHLYSPGFQRGPWPFLPFALDNGAFIAFDRGQPWDEAAWLKLLGWAKASKQAPRWVLVPDVVQDARATLDRWHQYRDTTAAYGWPLAFAVQDGMRFADVPPEAQVVFLGGSIPWKRDALRPWCKRFPRVHVGRINSGRWLRRCEAAGAESIDGTRWFQGTKRGEAGADIGQAKELSEWLAEASGEKPRRAEQTWLWCDDFEPATVPGSKCATPGGPRRTGAARRAEVIHEH